MKKVLNGHRTVAGHCLVDDEDFDRAMRHKWHVRPDGYVAGMVNRKTTLMHRFIAKTPKGKVTDHINGNRRDNRRSNLRVCNMSENMANTRAKRHSDSGIKGVLWDKVRKKWAVYLKHNYICMNIGRFDRLSDAKAAYEVAATVYFGKFAKVSEAV